MKRKFIAPLVIFTAIFVLVFVVLSGGEQEENSFQNAVYEAQKSASLVTYSSGGQISAENKTEYPDKTKTTTGVLVTRVIDGDTIEIEGGQKIRYIGIDTPETSDPRAGVQCFGKEATAKNRTLVEGKKVQLEKDISETDKYGRLLRYIYLDGKLVNEILVKEGFAFSSPYPPDIKHQEFFIKAEKTARENAKGLWGACSLIAGELTSTAINKCPIKGNISSDGEKIYHLPGQKYYNRTVISESKDEKWFCSESEAEKSGWRKSKI